MDVNNKEIVGRILSVIERDIVPLTRTGVAVGDKVFGAAILRKDDLSLVVAASNHETENPLWHGEVHTLKKFYEIPADQRPATRDCIFVATHEPCSLCLSSITWTGFDNFYFLFGYEDTSDVLNIPHDLKILQEVFRIENGDYAHQNAYWTSHGLLALVDQLPDDQQAPLLTRVRDLETTYRELSDIYQASKGGADIPLA
ncbi:MAG: nucleoside deaminase [Alphaproteobacteria bacterium]|nr:nucleoside deaminase [Alphaproteobacteria bacterium]